MKPILLATVLFVGVPVQNPPTLIEEARANNGKVIRLYNVEQPPLKPEEMRDLADLVIQARVVSEKTLLSEDQLFVVTEYVLAPIRVVSAKPAKPAMKPGLQEIRVRRPGGTIEVEGLQLTLVVNGFPTDAALGAGAEAVFFLTQSSTGPYFAVVGGPYGIYRVNNGRVNSLTKGVAAIRGDRGETITSLADLIARVEGPPKQ